MHKFAEKIMECVKSKVETRGIDNVSYDEVKEISEWVDIAKDIVCYDKDMRLIEAMDEEEKYGEMEYRMGYRGRDSRGRFVHRSGRGRSAGYTPYVHMMPPFMDGMYDEYDGMMPEDYRMGYSDGRGGRSGNYGGSEHSENVGSRGGSRYGESYDDYRKARRHYSETKSPEHQKEMREKIGEVFDDMESITIDMQKYQLKLQKMMQKIQ